MLRTSVALFARLVCTSLLCGCAEGEDVSNRRRDAASDVRDVVEASPMMDAQPPIDVPLGPDPDLPDVPVIPIDRCAAVEVCNDLDDTCNGVIDEGCPRAITVSMPPRFGSFSKGAATGNNPQSVAGRNEVLVGFYGRKGGVIDQLGAVTAPLSIVVDTTVTPFVFNVRVGASNDLPAYGGRGGSGFRAQCPTDTVLTTLRVQHRNGCTSPGICYEVLGDLVGQCERIQATLEGTAWSVRMVAVSELAVRTTDAMRREYVAPPGPYAGLWLRTGSFVDELSVAQTDLTLERR
ncbi:MAG: hypothetical protein Q8Q09_09890 [Deltaproteobacteria bacterium]|nr:hypothetical protein [Deltaproteobacteria bacterium]